MNKSIRLFYELGESDVTDWIQIFPGPGNYKHPSYGVLAVTEDKLRRLADSFAQRVYQQHIPVDAEHRTKESGALGYYKDVEARPDGLYARIELSQRGKRLLDDGAFRYFSAELYPHWESPTGEQFQDVLIGGAFTTRPFFKDAVQRPIAASEEFEASALVPLADGETIHQESKESNVDEQAFTELQQKYSELTTQNKVLETSLESANKANQQLSERVVALESDARRKRYTDMVTGHGGAKDGQHWFGEPEQHVAILMELGEKFGEDSELFKSYVAQQEKTAETIAASLKHSEVGRQGAVVEGNTAAGRFEAVIAQQLSAGAKDRPAAILEAARANPQLYREYQRERNINAADPAKNQPY